MSDNFLVYFGIRYTHSAGVDVGLLETGRDPRVRAAKKAGLKTWWGRLTDGEYYFLLIGAEIGRFGAESDLAKSVRIEDLVAMAEQTKQKLLDAGFNEETAIHFQMEAEY